MLFFFSVQAPHEITSGCPSESSVPLQSANQSPSGVTDERPARTRAEHLRWAKDRALEYVDSGDMAGAFASMLSDLGKHPELERAQEIGAVLGLGLKLSNQFDNPSEMRRFIEGFN